VVQCANPSRLLVVLYSGALGSALGGQKKEEKGGSRQRVLDRVFTRERRGGRRLSGYRRRDIDGPDQISGLARLGGWREGVSSDAARVKAASNARKMLTWVFPSPFSSTAATNGGGC
jgi:hypothetical protein